MTLLAFELATEACSVAVWHQGRVLERFELAPRRHAELALPWADELLSEAGLSRAAIDAVAFGRGPGAFTGVRLAVAIAQGIAMALDRPVVPVSTLAALARAHGGDCHVLAAIDARMGEVYSAAFALGDGDARPVSEEAVSAPEAVRLPDCGDVPWHGRGTGYAALDGRLQVHLGEALASVDAGALPRAADVACLGALAFARGAGVAPEHAEPAYLRNNVALTSAEQQALRASRTATP